MPYQPEQSRFSNGSQVARDFGWEYAKKNGSLPSDREVLYHLEGHKWSQPSRSVFCRLAREYAQMVLDSNPKAKMQKRLSQAKDNLQKALKSPPNTLAEFLTACMADLNCLSEDLEKSA
jgi:hypothetical protein